MTGMNKAKQIMIEKGTVFTGNALPFLTSACPSLPRVDSSSRGFFNGVLMFS